MTRKTTKRKQTPVNAVPLSDELQKDADRFLRNVHYDRNGVALVIVFRHADNGTVDANVLDAGLTDEYRDKMAKAAIKAISGKTLYYRYE